MSRASVVLPQPGGPQRASRPEFVALDLRTQRLARPEQRLLADEFLDRARAHAVGKRTGGPAFVLRFESSEEAHVRLLLWRAASYSRIAVAAAAFSDSSAPGCAAACGIVTRMSAERTTSCGNPAPSLPIHTAEGPRQSISQGRRSGEELPWNPERAASRVDSIQHGRPRRSGCLPCEAEGAAPRFARRAEGGGAAPSPPTREAPSARADSPCQCPRLRTWRRRTPQVLPPRAGSRPRCPGLADRREPRSMAFRERGLQTPTRVDRPARRCLAASPSRRRSRTGGRSSAEGARPREGAAAKYRAAARRRTK